MRSLLLPVFVALALGICPLSPSIARDGGIVYGDDHAFMVQAPEGWVLDNTSGAGQGLHAVFYPDGSSWAAADVVMYVNTAPKNESHQTIAELIEFNEARVRSESPDVSIEKLPDISTATGKSFTVRRYSGDKWGNFETVAYLEEETVLILFVLTSRSSERHDESSPAFDELLRGYQFVTKKVLIEE